VTVANALRRRAERYRRTMATRTLAAVDPPIVKADLAAGRFWELDVARTLAIGMMVAFHAAYDVDMLAPDLGVEPRQGGLKVLQVATGSLFLFLVGVSFSVSSARARAGGLKGRPLLAKQLRRAAEIGAAAVLVSLATWIALDDRWVRFGILHLIAVALALAPLLARLGAWNLALAAALVVAGRWIDGVSSDVPGALPVGFRPEQGSSGVDWYPLVPWLAAVLVGFVVGARLYPTGQRGRWATLLPRPSRRTSAVLEAPGRHSLAIYLGHQLVLIPLVAGTLLVVGVEIE
jgi:uncharacterized membrane protein